VVDVARGAGSLDRDSVLLVRLDGVAAEVDVTDLARRLVPGLDSDAALAAALLGWLKNIV
jgi:hypothetical protein